MARSTALGRTVELLSRSDFDLKLTIDIASIALNVAQVARLKRARREVAELKREVEVQQKQCREVKGEEN